MRKILFETAWRDGYEHFERVYDTMLGRSIKRKIDLPYEWYEPSSRGLYESLLDSNIKLEKKQGRARDGRGHYGFLDPIYRNIRDNFFQNDTNEYNKAPRAWYLDIETRSGRSYKHKGIGNLTIRNTRTQKESTLETQKVQEVFYNFGEEQFQYLDNSEWKPLSQNFYMLRNTGFPIPEKSLEEVSVIQIYDSVLNEVIMIATKEWKHREDYEHLMEYPLRYIVADSEIHLFEVYIKLFQSLDPLILYAWNGLGFDYPYLFNRMKNLGLNPDDLSNYGEVTLSEKEWQGRIEFTISTPGHHYIDMLEAYRKYVLAPRSSYALDEIVHVELNERKVQHDEYAQFDHFYLGLYNIPENPTKEQKNSKIYKLALKEGITEEVRELGHSEFCWYAYKDPVLIMQLDDKLKFTDLTIRTAERMGVLISDSFGTVRPWGQYIANMALKDKQVIPPTQEQEQPNVVGGYVMEPVKGKKDWVLSADVSSMYPNIMIAYNMSPETYLDNSQLPPEVRDLVLSYFKDQDEGNTLEYQQEVWDFVNTKLKEYNLSLGINGAVFTQAEIGIIPRLVHEIYNERIATRKIEGQYRNRKVLIENILYERNKGITNE